LKNFTINSGERARMHELRERYSGVFPQAISHLSF